MDLYYKQEITVGALVIAAGVIFVGGLMWLTGTLLDRSGQVTVLARFANVAGLAPGDPVQTAGVPVGRVEDVELEPAGTVLIHLAVTRDLSPRADARASVKSLDLLGSKYVDYVPGTSEDPLADGSVLLGDRETEFTTTATAIGDRAAELMLRTHELLTEDVRPTLDATRRAMEVIARVGDGQLIERATGALVSLQAVGHRLDSTLSNPAIDEAVSRMDEVAENLEEMTEGLAATTGALGQILDKVNTNQGTLGRLVNDTTLATDLHAVMEEMRLLLSDLRERPGRYMPRSVKVF
jgi:phospholipid/cholesterol/gamma-HCH transport system substrate-binding protein